MRATLEQLPAGDAGTYATVRRMVALIRRPSGRVRRLARSLARGFPRDEALARIFYFVRDRIRNSEDPPGIEWLQSPDVTLAANPAGDCDDKTILLASLYRALGVPVRLVVIATRSDRFSHVYLEARVGGRWLSLDPKNLRARPGWRPLVIRRAERFPVP